MRTNPEENSPFRLFSDIDEKINNISECSKIAHNNSRSEYTKITQEQVQLGREDDPLRIVPDTEISLCYKWSKH